MNISVFRKNTLMTKIQTNLTDSQWIIQADGLTKKFGEEVGVEDISLKIQSGTIFGFIGPSGCGKTTTVRLLLGIYPPTTGRAKIFSSQPHHFSQQERARIGYMPQLFMLHPDLTVWENLSFAASVYGIGFRRSKRFKMLLDLVELAGQERKKARDLSGGGQRRLSLAAALIHNPELMFFDEPTSGIDPVLRRKFWDYFQGLKARGCTLFVTTQYVGEAAYCDYVGVMADSRLLMVDTPDNLKRFGMGGEVIELQVDGYLSRAQVEQLRDQTIILNRRVKVLDDLSLQLIVDDAAKAIPELLRYFEHNGVKVQLAQKLEPSFDDVFVQLIERSRNNV
jgi:ABC-2 type transport system ATP-binding protein